MAHTVKIDPATHALFSQLAAEDDVPQEELARSVRACRKERFFQQWPSATRR